MLLHLGIHLRIQYQEKNHLRDGDWECYLFEYSTTEVLNH